MKLSRPTVNVDKEFEICLLPRWNITFTYHFRKQLHIWLKCLNMSSPLVFTSLQFNLLRNQLSFYDHTLKMTAAKKKIRPTASPK